MSSRGRKNARSEWSWGRPSLCFKCAICRTRVSSSDSCRLSTDLATCELAYEFYNPSQIYRDCVSSHCSEHFQSVTFQRLFSAVPLFTQQGAGDPSPTYFRRWKILENKKFHQREKVMNSRYNIFKFMWQLATPVYKGPIFSWCTLLRIAQTGGRGGGVPVY